MKYYQDITLLPNSDEDVPLYFLWSKLYQQLHLAFAEVANEKGKIQIGISFPGYDLHLRQLGCQLRLFSPSEGELDSLDLTKWLSRLRDYTHVKGRQKVPADIDGYAFFSRLIEKGSDERLARRRSRRLGVSYDEALSFFQDKKERPQPDRRGYLYPYVNARSLSNDEGSNRYLVTIVRSEADKLVFGSGFSTYGLSSDSSVPMF